MPNNMESLPPELQQRINAIIANAQQQAQAVADAAPAPAQQAPQAPVVAQGGQLKAPISKPPSLMDHVIAMRQDIAELQASVNAVAQVTDAVGNAVGQLYGMFHEQTSPTSFSQGFQTQGAAPKQQPQTDY